MVCKRCGQEYHERHCSVVQLEAKLEALTKERDTWKSQAKEAMDNADRRWKEIAELTKERDELEHDRDEFIRIGAEIDAKHTNVCAENTRLKRIVGRLKEYVDHGSKVTYIMCSRDKHSDYPCTCGLSELLEEIQCPDTKNRT